MRKLTIFLCVAFLAACTAKSTGERDLESVDFSAAARDIVSQVDFVYLRPGSDFFLGEVNAVKSFAGNWYILDNGQRGALMMFDKSGRGLALYDCRGRGPGEYSEIAGFDIDSDSGEVALLCGPPKIIILDRNLNFSREIALEKFYNRIACCRGGWLLFSGPEAAVDFMPAEGIAPERVFATQPDLHYTDNHNPVFIRDGQRLFFQTESDDALYEIAGRRFVKAVQYDYPDRKEAQRKHAGERLVGMDALKYTRPQLLCAWQGKGGLSFVYRKLVYRLNTECGDSCINCDLAIPGLGPALTKVGERLVGWIYAYDYNPERFAAGGALDGIQVNHIPMNRDMAEGGNPVLVISTLSENLR